VNIKPACSAWATTADGGIHCLGPIPMSTAQYTIYVLLVIASLLLIGFIVYQLRRRYQEELTAAAIQRARYNRFLELLRDVKWNMLNRNCW
jgi:hypothetical protein